MQVTPFASAVILLLATAGVADERAKGDRVVLVTAESGTSMTCLVGGQEVVAKVINDDLLLEVDGAQLSWLVRERQEDGLFVFVALDPQIQDYPLGFALVSFEDQVMIFSPPEAGLQPSREDLTLVQCK